MNLEDMFLEKQLGDDETEISFLYSKWNKKNDIISFS